MFIDRTKQINIDVEDRKKLEDALELLEELEEEMLPSDSFEDKDGIKAFDYWDVINGAGLIASLIDISSEVEE